MGNKTYILVASLIVLALTGACTDSTISSGSPPKTAPSSTPSVSTVSEAVPAYLTTKDDLDRLPPTLVPSLFTGNTARAYKAAKEVPRIIAQMPCYCYCSRTIGHKSLHSCFEDRHAEVCDICQNSALLAYTLSKQGMDVAHIREKIIAKYRPLSEGDGK